jgi:hypothetical protein
MKFLKYLLISALFIFIFPAPYSVAKMSPERTAEFMKKAMNYDDSVVISKAALIKLKYPNNYLDQICETFDILYLSWKYRPDPNGKEKFYKASTTLKTFKGDCDDYAIAMVSLLVALGGNGRVVCVKEHAYPEAYIGKNLSDGYTDSLTIMINKHYEKITGYPKYANEVNYHKDPDGTVWLNMDWWEYYPGSRFHCTDINAEHLVIYPDGNYQLAYLNKKY